MTFISKHTWNSNGSLYRNNIINIQNGITNSVIKTMLKVSIILFASAIYNIYRKTFSSLYRLK